MFEYEKEVIHLVALEKFGMSSHDSALSSYEDDQKLSNLWPL